MRLDDSSAPLTPGQRLRFAATVVALGLFVLLVNLVGCQAPPGTPALPTTSRPSVAQLDLSTGGFCTAWLADDGLVATAAHCCPDGALHSLTHGRAIPGAPVDVVYVDKARDVCILSATMLGDRLPLALQDPELGAPVWTEGFPAGILSISAGYFAGRTDDQNSVDATGMVVYFGASGSPVLDETGHVVGLMSAMVAIPSIARLAPVEAIRAALTMARSKIGR